MRVRDVGNARQNDATPEGYDLWLRRRSPRQREAAILDGRVDETKVARAAVLLMITRETTAAALRRSARSLAEQILPFAEVVLVGDAPNVSSACHTVRNLVDVTAVVGERAEYAACMAQALAACTAEWVVVLPPGDVLHERALLAIGAVLLDADDAIAVSVDHDEMTDDERGRVTPHFKPDWSPRLFLSGNYLGDVVCLRRSAVDAAGGFVDDDAPTAGYDLLLRMAERDGRFLHIAEPLHSRAPGKRPWPTAAGPAAAEPAKRSVQRALARRGVTANIDVDGSPWLRVRRRHSAAPSVTIVIPTRDRLDLLEPCVRSLCEVTSYDQFQVLIADNDSRDEATLEYLAASAHRVVPCPGRFNFSRIVNTAMANVDTELAVLLNNDTVTVKPDWLDAMVEEMWGDTGAVGCRLVRSDGAVEHEGVAVGLGEASAINVDLDGYTALGDAVREVSAVTAACMLVHTDAFAAVRGFDPRLAVAYGDVDFCLRLWRNDRGVLYTPHAVMSHIGSASRRGVPDSEDDRTFRGLWSDASGRLRDPFVNPSIDGFAPLRLRAPDKWDLQGDARRLELDRATVYARGLERELAARDRAASALLSRLHELFAAVTRIEATEDEGV